MKRILAILVLCSSVSGCIKEQSFAERLSNNKNPLTALHADATSTRYENSFWERHKQKQTQVWKRAVLFCKSHDEYTNCYAVNEVHGPYPEEKNIAKRGTSKRKESKANKSSEPQSWTEVQTQRSKALKAAREKEAALVQGMSAGAANKDTEVDTKPNGDNDKVENDSQSTPLVKNKNKSGQKSKTAISKKEANKLTKLKSKKIRAKKITRTKRKKRKSRRAKRKTKKRIQSRKKKKTSKQVKNNRKSASKVADKSLKTTQK